MTAISSLLAVRRASNVRWTNDKASLLLSQEELAGLAGISRQIVVRIEKCEGNGLAESVDRVRAALERGGVAFIEASTDRGPGVAMSRIEHRA